LDNAMYVDIGANHPTDISNTYLLYRRGQRGLVIEPNQELLGLFKKFRKRDIALGIGCGNKSTVLKFNISKTPVLSSFSDDRSINIASQVYLPVIPLDLALANIDCPVISLLSIDVEGLNMEVLEGAVESLKKTLIDYIEYDTEEERGRFDNFLKEDFELKKQIHCNLLYINKKLSAALKKM
jgi:FkbM family methyltransferase